MRRTRWSGNSAGARTVMLGALAVALCCGGPLLIVALATTGLGAALAAFGLPTLGAAVAVAGIVAGAWWLVRGRGRIVQNSGRSQEVMRDG